MIERIRQWSHHPLVNITVGVVMIASAIGEMLGDVVADSFGFTLGAAHGLFVVGALHALKAIPELVEGVNKVEAPRNHPAE